MRKKKLIPTLALVLTLLCGISIGASAAGGLQEITAYLSSGITVTLDGEVQTLLDASGTRVYPITYNGTTYLPVRAVAGLAGLSVDWDQATQTVLLGSQIKGVDLIETYNIYHTSKENAECDVGQVKTADGQTAEISGITQSHWVYLNCAWGAGASASYNLQGKHDTLTFSYYSPLDVTLRVLGDDESVLGEYTVTGGAVAKTVTLPLFGTNELTFQVVPNGRQWPNVRIFDAYLDAE